MRTYLYLIIAIITLFSAYGSVVPTDEMASPRQPLSVGNLVLNPVSSMLYDIVCTQGDTLTGKFRIVSDGGRFPGDQTRYDNWLLGGIDFLILDELNYLLWIDLEPITAGYEKRNVVEHRWQFSVPSSGTWYLIYINNTIYTKQIENTIIHRGSVDFLMPMILGLLGLVIVIGLALVQRTRKR